MVGRRHGTRNPVVSTETSKQEREREFHNAAFSDNRRSQIAPAYSIIHDSRVFYEGFIKEHAVGASLLEFGCGATAMASTFGSTAKDIVGIDISDVAVAEATARAEAAGLPATYRVMDAESLDFPDRSFDLICSTAILHHLDLRKAYAEIARTLRPGGHAIFMEPLGYNPFINLYRRLTPHMRTPDEHPLMLDDIALADAYFHRVEARYYVLTSLLAMAFRRRRSFKRILYFLEDVDQRLFRAIPFLRRYAWQVVLVLSQPRSSARPEPAA